jgi:outer membrane protein TolC
MRLSNRFLYFLSFFLVGTTVCAQKVSANVDVWTWARCLSAAKENNFDYKAAEANFLAAEKQIRVAQAGYFPNLSASLSYTNDSITSTNYGASLNASQNLFAGFLDQSKVLQAEANRDIVKSALIAAKAKLSSDLKTAFASLTYSQALVKLTEDITERRSANLRLVDLRFQSGRENRGSLMLSNAYLEQSKLEALQAKNLVRTAQAQLAKVLGQEGGENIAVTGEVPGVELSTAPDLHELSLQTPDYLQALASEKLAEAARLIARASFFPSLNLTGSTGVAGSDWFPSTNRWTVGASLTWPLWSGGKEIANYQASLESARAVGFSRTSTLQLVVGKLQQALSTFQESSQKSVADLAFLNAAVVRSKIARTKYNNGLLTFEEWDLIENDLINREKVRLSGLRDKVIADATWEQTQGKGSVE